MAKKSRRTRAKYRNQTGTAMSVVGKQLKPTMAVSQPKVSAISAEPSPMVQAARYRYLVPELRRIGIIAGALLLVLIVLTFVIG